MPTTAPLIAPAIALRPRALLRTLTLLLPLGFLRTWLLLLRTWLLLLRALLLLTTLLLLLWPLLLRRPLLVLLLRTLLLIGPALLIRPTLLRTEIFSRLVALRPDRLTT